MSEQEAALDKFVDGSSSEEKNDEVEQWERSAIAELSEWTDAGGTPRTSNEEYWGGDIPWVQTGELTKRHIRSTEKQITETGLEESTAKLFPPGTLLIGMYGEPTVGESALLEIEATTNQACCGVFPDQSRVNAEFLHQTLQYEKPRLYSLRAGSGQQNIRQGIIRKFEVNIPPLEEQRKIASVLYTGDQSIQKSEEIIDQYERVLDGTIQDIATKGIDNENLTERKIPMLPERWGIPEHWDLEFLESLTTLITDGAHQTPTYVEEGVPFLKIENIKQEKIDWDDVARIPREEHEKLIKSGEPKEGDILLSKNGTVGITKVVEWGREFSHFVSLSLIRPQEDRILPDYLATLLESRICMHQAQVRSKKNTVNNLHLEEIRKFSIPVPPIEEQEDILEKISSIQDALNLEKQNQNRLQRLKNGLMQELLTGEVRTHDTDIEIVDDVLQHG